MVILAQSAPIFAYMPFLVFLFFGGLAVGVAAIGVSLFRPRSQMARNTSLITVLWGVLSPLLVSILPNANLHEYDLFYFAGPIVVGLFAFWISRWKWKLPIRTGRILYVAIVGGAILTGGYLWGRSVIAGGQMMAILNGSESVRITEFRILNRSRGVMREVICCRDQALCEYLTTMLRGKNKPGQPRRSPAIFSFRFSSGLTYTVENGYLHENGWSASIPEGNPADVGMTTHSRGFPTPPPPRFQEIWNFAWGYRVEGAKGSRMVIEEGDQVRWE